MELSDLQSTLKIRRLPNDCGECDLGLQFAGQWPAAEADQVDKRRMATWRPLSGRRLKNSADVCRREKNWCFYFILGGCPDPPYPNLCSAVACSFSLRVPIKVFYA